MTDRVNADGLPLPKPHLGSAETYLHRACQLLDQISRQLDELLVQGQAPVVGVSTGSNAQIELVTEPADPQPPARKAPARKKTPPATKKGA